MRRTITVSTTLAKGLADISDSIQEEIEKNGWRNGILTVFVPHTTAGITINENADPDVSRDMIYALSHAFPDHAAFCHMEGNSSAHIMTTLTGSSEMLIIENGRPILGTWQGIYLAEFDGPRQRTVHLKFITG